MLYHVKRNEVQKMKVSEITIDDICTQVRMEEEYMCERDIEHLKMLKKAAEEYVKEYTGLTVNEIDQHEDITAAVLVLISDMYDNRQMQVDKSNANRVVETILGMHCKNLL